MASWEFNPGMHRSMPRALPRLGALLGALLTLLAGPLRAAEAARVRYDAETARLEAEVEDVPLSRVLGLLAGTTGWDVRVEPGADPAISTRFAPRPAREGLDRLLGGLDFSLTVPTNGPTRLLVYRTGADRATRRVAAGDDRRIANQLVLRLPPGSDLDPEALARELGGRLVGSVPGAGAHLLEFPDADAAGAAREALAGRDGVAAVEDNWRIDRPDLPGTGGDTGPPTLRIRPGEPDASRRLVAIIDTAIQPLGPAYDAFVVDRLSVVPGAAAGSGAPAHGTTMAARFLTAAEAALGPGSTASLGVLGIDVYGGRDQTSSFDVARGVALAVEKGAGILNLSLGGPNASPVLYDVLRQATGRGVLVIAAAGNTPSFDPNFPAGFPEVVGVTAGLADGRYAPYANRAATVDLMLQGNGLVPYGGATWRVTGTSVAAAHASGVAAALWLRNGGTPASLRAALERSYGLAGPGR